MSSETLVFLPWLRLKKPIEIYELIFCPVGKDIGFSKLPDCVANQASLISSSYTDRAGHAIPDFTLVLRKDSEKPHDLSSEQLSIAREAASVLFFCSLSLNDYYCSNGDYCNSSMFSVVGQRFSLSDPSGVAITLRRRDGETLSGGLRHGQVRFVCPSHYAINHQVSIDEPLLAALLTARAQGSKTFDRLISVLGLIELANTDNDNMSQASEIILMGSAFETFLDVKDKKKPKALEVGKLFKETFQSFDTRTAQDAINSGRSVFIDSKGAQPQWSVLQTWCHELYQLRNDCIHSQSTPNRTWGWYELEHLVAAAFAFPLMIKLKLSSEGFYSLTSDDKQRCYALPDLLSITGWNLPKYEFNTNWRNTISYASWSITKEDVRKSLLISREPILL